MLKCKPLDTGAGAPTMVLNHRPPTMYEDLNGFRGAVSGGFLSFPTAGKHIAFDGRLLHGGARGRQLHGEMQHYSVNDIIACSHEMTQTGTHV